MIITEFLASNVKGLTDEDGDSSDWIELFNSGATAVNLFGWHLTDEPGDLTKWTLPATNLAPKGFLIVFASGKDRTVPGAPLHTNFRLSADGGYLALVKPDGRTIASEWRYGPQRANYSYGLGQMVVVNPLVASNALVRWWVPSEGALGLSWVSNSFNDAAWWAGTNGVGYEVTVPGFAVRNFKAKVQVNSLTVAEAVIATPAHQAAVYEENSPVVNYVNTGPSGRYGSDRTVPGFTIGVNQDDYVIEATGIVTIPAPGNWTFGVSSDDGFGLTVGPFSMSHPNPRSPADTLQTFWFAAAGEYPLRLVFYERSGGSEVELFAAQGSYAAWGANFRLVGDTANDGLAVRSLPVAGSGLGYRWLICTDVQAVMFSHQPCVYVRVPFTVTNAAGLSALTLSVRYDDGFVAWLNGVEVARRNAPAGWQWNAAATAPHPAFEPELINLSDRLGLVRQGANVLALQGLNESATNSDFFLGVELAEIKAHPTTHQFFPTPTPGAYNGNTGFGGFVAPLAFHPPRGFYDAPVTCVITTSTVGATIRYTTNGSWPSATNGQVYTGPIVIAGTTTLRAIGYAPGLSPTEVATHTYIFVQDVVRQSPNGQAPGPGWPTAPSSAGQIYDYGMDPDIVNVSPWKDTILEDLKSLPSFSIVMDLKDLFDDATGIYANPRGDEIAWERPCSLELIHPDGTPGFQINCGIRIRGGYSRSGNNPKHAFRFFFRHQYGAAKLRYPLFGSEGADRFDKIDLRTFQNYCWSFNGDSRMICLRDQLSRDLQLAMGHPAERGRFYHLYLNGQYWGLYNTAERPEASYGETYLGGRAEDYDTIKVDPDLGYSIEATDGNTDAWYQLWSLAVDPGFADDANYFRVQGLNPDGTPNPAYPNLLEVDNLIDYMLLIIWSQNLDAPISNFINNTSPNNFFALRNRTGQYGGFRFFAHDSEHTLLVEHLNTDRTGPFPAGDPTQGSGFAKSNPQYLWQRLSLNAEFRMRVADRIQRHFFHGGPLSPEGVMALFMARSNEIYRAMVCESARWGDAKVSTPFTRNTWLTEMRRIGGTYIPQRTGIALNQLKAKGLFPNLSAPGLNRWGGYVSNGFILYLTNPNASGVIYYTLNGPDPRRRGGSIHPAALAYSPGTPIPINFQTTVRARVLSGSIWSALAEASFFVAQDFSGLRVTEIMYHPPAWGSYLSEALEFIELKNVGSRVLDLSGLAFTEGISFTFTNGTRLGPGQFLVLARDPAVLALRYPGLVIHGAYTGKLDNGGERLTLSHVWGGKVLSFTYNDAKGWPVTADGLGFSLVPRAEAALDWDHPASWRASAAPGGSPGADDPAPSIPPILINEALTHSVPPAVDWIELFNPTDTPVSVGGWFLTDDRTEPWKFRIPDGTVIPAGGYRVFTEADFNPQPGTSTSFALSAQGDEVYLLSGNAQGELTGYSHGFSFDAAEPGVSFGRHVNSAGDEYFVAQASPTPGAVNAGPRVGPLIVREIMYHPPDLPGGLDNTLDEYLLLENSTDQPLRLFDPAFPANTWRVRGGVGFDFPTNLTVPAWGALVLVNFDPVDPVRLSAFQAKYGQLAALPILGPYSGKLNNSGDTIQLYKPGAPTGSGVPWVLVEQIDYRDAAPWPPGPDGSGTALRRMGLNRFGNEPTNWLSAAPLTIVEQPQSLIVTNRHSVTLTVSAIGTGPLRYQWRRNEVDLPGATASTLTIPEASLADAGTYTVLISDELGSALSAPATLTVLVKPVMTRQPQSQIAVVGQTVTFQTAAYGTEPVWYRWRKNASTFRWPGEPTLTLTPVALADAGTYDVVLTNLATAIMGGYTRSSNVYLTVVRPPTDLVAMPGQTVTFRAEVSAPRASGTNMVRFSWQFRGVELPGATGAELVLTNLQLHQFGPYSFTVINMDGGTATFPVRLEPACADCDGDGLPDAWERAHGLDPTTPADALADHDQDGLLNRDEYLAGTDPRDPHSCLRLTVGVEPAGAIVLSFQAVSNLIYGVEWRPTLGSGAWQTLTNIEAGPTSRTINLHLPAPHRSESYYRLVLQRP